MPEWLNATVPAASELPSSTLFGQILQSAWLGVAVAIIYFLTQRKARSEAVPFVATLVLLTVLICMVTRVIGDNVARAFSLAGALAIIRFRTVVDDTRDTAFVIAAVVTGMAVGAGMLPVALAGLPVLALSAGLLTFWGGGYTPRATTGTLVVRLAVGVDPVVLLAVPHAKYVKRSRITSINTAKQGAAVEFTYNATLLPGATGVALTAELQRTEGVQGVEWKENNGTK